MTTLALIRELHTIVYEPFPEITGLVTVADVWDRHVSLCYLALARAVKDFGLFDLGEMCERHFALFPLVDRTVTITSVPVSARAAELQQEVANAIDTATGAADLVTVIRESPHFAAALHHRVESSGLLRVQPLLLALSLIARDNDVLARLMALFTPEGERA